MGWDGLYKSKSGGTDTLELEEDCLFWGGQNVAGSDTDAELEDGACGFCGGHAFGGFTIVDATRLCSVLEAEVLGLSEAACSLLLAGALSSSYNILNMCNAGCGFVNVLLFLLYLSHCRIPVCVIVFQLD